MASHLSGRPVRLPVLATRNSSRTWFCVPSTGPSTETVALKTLPRLLASSMPMARAVKARMATTMTIRPVTPRSSRLRRSGGDGGWLVAGGLDIATLRLAARVRVRAGGPARTSSGRQGGDDRAEEVVDRVEGPG